MTRHVPKPLVMIVGGPDVDVRLPLMRRLSGSYDFVAVGSDRALTRRVRDAGFEFEWYPLCRANRPWIDMLGAYRLWRLCRLHRPALVHTFDTKPCIWGRYAAALAGVDAIAGTITGLGSLYADDRVCTRLLRLCYRLLLRRACAVAGATLFHNDEDMQRLVREGVVDAHRCKLIAGSGVDTAYFNPALASADARARLRAELGVPDDAKIVLCVARLVRAKGVLEYARAARQVSKGNPRAYFVLAGPDDQASTDRLSAVQLRELQSAVRWLGPRNDVRDLMAASDVFVCPSYREGLPRALLEAASMALPLVATDVAGCRAIVIPGVTGLLVPKANAEELARAVESLVGDSRRAQLMASRSRASILHRHDIRAVSAQLDELYRRLLDAAACRLGAGLPRWCEICVSVLALTALSPLMALVAIAIKLDTSGPVLFRHRRIGRGGLPFELLKFRSMISDRPSWPLTVAGDSRVTRIGALIRRTKLDELPSLWNVLRADMALVGPRPEAPEYVDPEDALWKLLLQVRPGLTDPATLAMRNEEELLACTRDPESYYAGTLLPAKMRCSAKYMRRRTWASDVCVLFRTAARLLSIRALARAKPELVRAEAAAFLHGPWRG